MIDSLAAVLSDFLSSYGGREETQESRAFGAYRDAFRSRETGLPADDLSGLIQQMKDHGVAGAYTDPGTRPELRVYFECWRAGLAPKELRSVRRTERRGQRGPLTRRKRS